MWLRAGVPEDTQRLLAIQRAASLAGYQHIFPAEQYPFPDQQVLAECWTMLTDPACQVLVGVGDDSTVVGFVARQAESISRLYVDPAYWRRGYGARLLAAAVDGARADGHRTARLWVLADNRNARTLYERHGWRIDGRTGSAGFPPYPTEVGYRLELTDELTAGDAAAPPTSRSTGDRSVG
ncbi:N-acetyltransferase [Actinocatenispora thailandica]|uniref:N-acetyltransferase n=1 Tax=Actinocatenispora thailandica TaxID=227318 RepID=A0A7R7DJU0_9ACTN|nr:GNAT family N-acetyltransferase [Actinocatenispora thailandica]BCJ33040.1 N-acetyltransferase [Actinocatenispora thailandica]